jgi:hypothetical protein
VHDGRLALPSSGRAQLEVHTHTPQRPWDVYVGAEGVDGGGPGSYSKNESHVLPSEYDAYTHLVRSAEGPPPAARFYILGTVYGLERMARGAPTSGALSRDVLMTLAGAANEGEARTRVSPWLVRAVAAVAERTHRFLPAWPVLSPRIFIYARDDDRGP